MSSKREYIFIAGLVVLAILLFGWGSEAGIALQGWLRGAPPASPGELPVISTGSGVDATVNETSAYGGLSVPVYSRYPFNLKNEFTISAGTAEGIAVGNAAMADGYLVGTVTEVSAGSATIRTIFDGRFQLPVRIGASAADALLRGGNDPRLILIASDAAVGEGDEVRSAAAGMPYGLPVGFLQGLHDSADRAFREASLQVLVDPAGLRQVIMIPHSG